VTEDRLQVAEAIATWARATGEPEGPALGGGGEPPAPRSVADCAVVELREVTAETVRAICRLQVAPSQRRFVAPNAVSFAEALFEPKAWYRAVYADGVPAGFAMLYVDVETPEYFLWRFMVADGLQGLGYGRRALELVVDHVRTLPGATELLTSWVPGTGSPEGFYLAFGFEPTGKVDEGEIVARLALA
jgi:diamine N-acetyltransferase